MSFITRCPACHTAFKVVSDQLKISEGWVRCGHCQQIFDATLDLQPWWPGTDAAAGAPPPPGAAPPAPATAPTASTPPAPPERPAEFQRPPVPPPTAPPPSAQEEPDARVADWPEVARHDVLPPAPPDPESAPPDTSEPVRAAEPWVAEPPPSFVRQAQRRAFWRRTPVRLALVLVAVLLLAALGVQASLHWRDSVAAHVPAAEPALQTLCAPLECEVKPPRQLDDIIIDSSVLLRRGPGRYTFNVVVRNTAAVELAAPALELTLTDIHDQVLVRRVLPPQEWPEPRNTLAPGAEWPVQFELELATSASQVMTGYRAILFYP